MKPDRKMQNRRYLRCLNASFLYGDSVPHCRRRTQARNIGVWAVPLHLGTWPRIYTLGNSLHVLVRAYEDNTLFIGTYFENLPYTHSCYGMNFNVCNIHINEILWYFC